MDGKQGDVVVIGAGPAGLATSRELSRHGVEHVVLERGADVGHTWDNLYDSLTLHTGRHMSALPGLRFERGTPLFPTRAQFAAYLKRYATAFDVPVRTDTEVTEVRRSKYGWRVVAADRTLEARAIVVATGIVASPVMPMLPGAERFGGRVLHSVEYRRPGRFRGRRVLVVGVGNSGAEIAAELAGADIEVTISVRSGANVVPLRLFGVPIQYAGYVIGKLPRPARQAVVAGVGALTELRRGPPLLPRPAYSPLDRIPLIGFHLDDAIHTGRVRLRGALTALTEHGARFSDGAQEPFDDVILATGYRAAIDFLDGVARRDPRGFGLRTERVSSADHRDLFFVGHNYDATGGIFGIARDAPLAAKRIADLLDGGAPR